MSITIKPRQTPTLRQLEEQDGAPVLPYDERFLRHVPTQGRSTNTLAHIVDAAEKLLEDPEVGRELITTAHIGEMVGVPIGTVYRYFEDIVAILDYVWPQRRDTVRIRFDLVSATAVEADVVTEPA